jgi:GTP-binding protein
VARPSAIVKELKKYDPSWHAKPRWLVLNKMDMVPGRARSARQGLRRRLRWKGPVFEVSALAREGLRPTGRIGLRTCGVAHHRCRR